MINDVPMSTERKPNQRWREAAMGAGCVVLLSLGLMLFKPTGQYIAHLSYDLPFLFRPFNTLPDSNVVIVAMEEVSRRYWPENDNGDWDRSLHTALLRELDRRGAKAVVFDIWFNVPWANPAVDQGLAEAIKQARCKVVLAAALPDAALDQEGRTLTDQLLPAIEPLGSAAPWGIFNQPVEPDGVVRRHHFIEEYPNLAWRTAEILQRQPPPEAHTGWIHYYGPPQTIRTVPYHHVFEPKALAEDALLNKVVFVGAGGTYIANGELVETFATPFSRWTGQKLTGVEIHATEFLNLTGSEWLRELPWGVSLAIFVFVGALAGGGLALCRPYAAIALALHGMFLASLTALLMVRGAQVWFPWLLVAGIQFPAALGWSLLVWGRRVMQAKEDLDVQIEHSKPLILMPQPGQGLIRVGRTDRMPAVPDHTLLRCIGRGAYGEIWLAQNTIGIYHAVKVVYRQDFEDADPYEREFNGIKQFMPISRLHATFVHILHVGRNDEEGYFYYVMEVGDDVALGQQFDPKRYTPKSLARHVKRQTRMTPDDCVFLGLILTNGLEFLHKKKLIHRDIKPSNIIYVNGRPKFADIGLVTEMGLDSSTGTFIGTPGYIPPEGPGRPTADIYSLGKVLYEAGMGRSRLEYPDLPTTLIERPEVPAFRKLNDVILKACETNVHNRYQTASEMHADLLDIQISLCTQKV